MFRVYFSKWDESTINPRTGRQGRFITQTLDKKNLDPKVLSGYDRLFIVANPATLEEAKNKAQAYASALRWEGEVVVMQSPISPMTTFVSVTRRAGSGISSAELDAILGVKL